MDNKLSLLDKTSLLIDMLGKLHLESDAEARESVINQLMVNLDVKNSQTQK